MQEELALFVRLQELKKRERDLTSNNRQSKWGRERGKEGRPNKGFVLASIHDVIIMTSFTVT